MLKPLGNRVLLEIVEEEKTTPSGIVLPESAKEKSTFANVLAVGKGKILENGERLEMEVHVGDRVVFEDYAGKKIKIDKKEYLILKDTDILAVVE